MRGRSGILGVTLGALAAALTWGIVVDRSPASLRRSTAATASTTTPTTVTTTEDARSRTSVSGTLMHSSADAITVRQADGTEVEVPLDPATTICRIVCSATWTELRPGDDILAGLETIGATAITRFVDANLTGGWVVIDAVEPDALLVRWERAGAPTTAFRVFVGWATRVDGPGAEARACPGDTVHFTGSSDLPPTAAAPAPDVWATTLSTNPSPACATLLAGR